MMCRNGGNYEQDLQGNCEALSQLPARALPLRDDISAPARLAIASDPTDGSSPGLLNRRGARRQPPPFVSTDSTPAQRVPTNEGQYLRPITPTQPLMGDEDMNETAMRTPPTDTFNHEGPMTPTNNAGPFVFDGSAGRVVGTTGVDAMSGTEVQI